MVGSIFTSNSSGTTRFILQRFASLCIIIYITVCLLLIINHINILVLLHNTTLRYFTIMTSIAVALAGWVCGNFVISDYIHYSKLRFIMQVILIFNLFFFPYKIISGLIS